jgi:hypothetical protein
MELEQVETAVVPYTYSERGVKRLVKRLLEALRAGLNQEQTAKAAGVCVTGSDLEERTLPDEYIRLNTL